MNKIRCIIVFLLMMILLPLSVKATSNKMNIYLFYGDGCPHCAAEKEFLNNYLKNKKDIKLYTYEVWYNEDNQKAFKDVQKLLKKDATGIPYLIIGRQVITGFSENSTEERIKHAINYYLEVDYDDEVGMYFGYVEKKEEKPNEEPNPEISTKPDEYKDEIYDIPLLGKKQAKDVSLVLSAVVIGLVDGFNPCAMWILIFLISMLIGMENKRRKWILGITFLIASALVYFLFMISWLDLAIFLNQTIFIRMGISFVAIIFGGISVFRFFKKTEDGCEVVDSKNRKKIINSIKKIVKEKTFILAFLGIIVLAISVNIIELLCSLGLPVMFTEILALNDISKTSQIMYVLLYVLFFLIDDIIILTIAMKTLEIKAISNKYGKYSHLIGGLIMLLIGTLMLLKPEWLMFNF